MKKLMGLVIAMTLAISFSSQALAVTKCVPDGRGGQCCWDPDRDGPFKPLSC
jgi:hypothetical protein